jgi:hypothetical protein
VNILFALRVKINAFDATRYLVEADVVEAFKTCPIDRLHSVIWDKKIFFPTHKEMLLLHPVFCYYFGPRRVFLVRREPPPVLPVNLLVRTPLGMLSNKGVFAADYFSLKVCGEARMVFREAYQALVGGHSSRYRGAHL